MAADRLPDPGTPFGKAVHERLVTAKLIWLTTVGKDGTPQPNPVWFLYEDGEILVYSLHSANRLTHIRQRPQVSLNFDSNGSGGDVIVIAGLARIAPDEQLPSEHPGYVAKYDQPMANVSGDKETFAASYNVAVRIEIRKVRGF
jgi:PPOX class probable F420-dependent enzyme